MSAITKTMTLADVLAEIKSGDRRYERPIDCRRALKKLSDKTRRGLASISADLPVVDGILGKLMWQNIGFKSGKRFENWCSDVRKAVKDSLKQRRSTILVSPKAYPDCWKEFIKAVDEAVKDEVIGLFARVNVGGVANWCAANGINPAEFDDETAADMAEWYQENRPSNGRRPSRHLKDLISAWNSIAEAGVGGIRKVKKPIGRQRVKNIQLDEMPTSLRADIDAYITYSRTRFTVGDQVIQAPPPPKVPGKKGGRFSHLRGIAITDVAAEDRGFKVKRGRSLGPVAEDTVNNTRHAMRTLITAGARRVEDLSDPERPVFAPIPMVEGVRLVAFLNQHTVVDAFDMLEARMIEDGKIDEDTEPASLPSSFHSLGSKICAVATWAKIDQVELAAMRAIIGSSLVRTDSVGAMPAGRRAILDEMDSPEMVLAWFNAPMALWKRAEAERKKGNMTWEVVKDAETAFIAWLLSRLPIRRKNIGQLTIRMLGKEEAMIRLGRFDGERTVIVIPGRFTKTGRPVRFPIDDPEGEKMLRGLLAKGGYREAAMKLGGFKDTEFLFVGDSSSWAKRNWRVRGHRAFSALGAGYKARMREFGIPATLHVARHISAQIALDFDDSALDVVANLLGSSRRTVEKHYLSDRTSKAAKTFDSLLRGSVDKAIKMLTEGKEEE
jgi:hypothetical protein